MLHDVLQKIFLSIIIYRLFLAARHYNENSDCLQAVTKDHATQLDSLSSRKETIPCAKRRHVQLTVLYSPSAFYLLSLNPIRYKYWLLIAYILFQGYTETLLDMLIREYKEEQTSHKNSIQDLRESMPAPLPPSFEKHCKETAVEQYVSRFAHHWVTRKVITGNHVCVFVCVAHLLPVL